jgi:hypothetical protein
VNFLGQTNLSLDFWLKRVSGNYNGGVVSASADGVNWTDLTSFGWNTSYPSGYQHYAFNLDALGLPYGNDVRIRFRCFGNYYGGTFVWDDVRIFSGDPNAPVLSFPTCATNGQFQFQLSGPLGTNYIVQASTNLVNWIPIAVAVIPTSGVTNIVDPYATNYSRRFYRSVQ